MEPHVTTAPLHKEGFLGKAARRTKAVASIFGSFVKILFNIGVGIFVILLIVGLFSGSEETTQSRVLYGTGEDEIAVVNLTGAILDVVPTGPFDVVADSDVITPRKVTMVLEKIKQNSAVKAVVLRINSPGGSVTASDEIYETIVRFKQETGLPVIASLSEVAASGGYYIALAADTIIASPTTITGSIGVIANTYNFKELADNYGVREISINSGDSKNFLSPFQEPDEEEQAILKSIVDEAYQQFLTRVAESRQIPQNVLLPIADGRPLSGRQAMAAQLINQTGSFHDTVIFTREQINSADASVVEYGVGGLFESLLQGAMKPFMRSELRPITLLQQLSGKAAYLYMPF
jgi:protease-4